MRRMFEFVCASGHHMDKLTDYESKSVPCDCGETAHRVLSTPAIKLEGWSGSFPGAANRFEKSHLNKLKAEQKANS